jgi:hypothetical protein
MKPVSRLNAGFFPILVLENDFDFRRRGNVWKNQVPHAGSRHRLPKPLACPNALYVPIGSTNAWPVHKQFKQLAQTAGLSKL